MDYHDHCGFSSYLNHTGTAAGRPEFPSTLTSRRGLVGSMVKMLARLASFESSCDDFRLACEVLLPDRQPWGRGVKCRKCAGGNRDFSRAHFGPKFRGGVCGPLQGRVFTP